MKNISQRTLQYNIKLVQWENPDFINGFPLVTVHSLLIDKNPKFIQLKQLVHDYNQSLNQKFIQRPQLKRVFIEKLYKMLCQLTRISNSQNQLQFLNKIYAWAFSSQEEEFDQNNLDSNQFLAKQKRPTTASTKTRPYSAHTTKARPSSGHQMPNLKQTQSRPIPIKTIEDYPKVDFTKLQYGEKQFFVGNRTLHPQEQKPKIKLKEFHRKVFYEELEEEEFEEFVEEKKQQQPKKQILKEITVQEELPLEEEKPQENVQGEGIEGQVPAGEDQVNIDDLVGDEEQPPQQQAQVVDKLKPKVTVYGNLPKQIPKSNKINLQRGIQSEFLKRNDNLIRNIDDQTYDRLKQNWGMAKSRNNKEMKRRAESARMVTKVVPYTKPKQETKNTNIETINLQFINPTTINPIARPKTAFKGQSDRKKAEILRDTFVTGKLSEHIPQVQKQQLMADKEKKFTVYPSNPKKKTFEEILKEAEERVNQDAEEEILVAKDKLAQNRVPMPVNKVAKSLTFDARATQQTEFVGQITGSGMPHNEFFKVAKKKKKKKKK